MPNQVSNISSIDLQMYSFHIFFPFCMRNLFLNLFDSTENLHIFEVADSRTVFLGFLRILTVFEKQTISRLFTC